MSANRKKLTNNFTVPVDRKYGIIILLCLLIGKKLTNNFIVSANQKKWFDNIIVLAKRKKHNFIVPANRKKNRLAILFCMQITKNGLIMLLYLTNRLICQQYFLNYFYNIKPSRSIYIYMFMNCVYM